MQGLDLRGVSQLIVCTGTFLFRFQLADLLLVGLDLILHAFDLHVALLQFQLHGFHIIGEQRVTGVDMVALLHDNAGNFLGGVQLDFLGFLRFYHAGKLQVGNRCCRRIHIFYRHHVCHTVHITAPAVVPPHQHAADAYRRSCNTGNCADYDFL